MLEFGLALLYAAFGAVLYRVYIDQRILQIAFRATLGLLSGAMLFALLRLFGLVKPVDAMALSELLLLICGGLLIGYFATMFLHARTLSHLNGLRDHLRERVRIRLPFPIP
ncbi:MAG: hypothetical protein AAF754_07730 [Pseudomonadota bacterium]